MFVLSNIVCVSDEVLFSKIALKGIGTANRLLLSALNYVNSVVGLHLYFVYDTLFNSEKKNANDMTEQDDACRKNRNTEMLIKLGIHITVEKSESLQGCFCFFL